MDEDHIFEAEAIRDQASHTSTESKTGEFTAETIFIENGLDQLVTFQLQGARNSTWLNIGPTFAVAATTNSYKTVTDYFPKYQMTAVCGANPTSGVLDVWMIKSKGR